jgi:hypothetical protein
MYFEGIVMDENIIVKLSIKIGLIIIFIILQIIVYIYAKANPPEVETEYTENGFTIKIYSPNKLVSYLNQYLLPIIIVIFSLCIFDTIYLLTNYRLNIFEKIISIIIIMYIAFILYIKKIVKGSINRNTIFFGSVILGIGIFLVVMRFID